MLDHTVQIDDIQHYRRDRTWFLASKVGGKPLWLQSDDSQLTACPEALLTLFFIPALHVSARLSTDVEVDSAWIDQTRRLLPIYHGWWNYPIRHPLTDSATGRSTPPDDKYRAAAAALCFTGGVDSFYSLLRGTQRPRYLLFANGFDIPLGDDQRFKAFRQSLHTVAATTGTRPIVVHTNLRQHPVFNQAPWERTHGAALAAIGMSLATTIDTLIIPSSHNYDNDIPWGSHWETDPLWSPPDRLTIVHDGAELSRRQKLVAIAAEPVVQQHLRVCWENRTATGNCSRCEKCLRTMVLLEATGQLARYHAVFDLTVSLADSIDRLHQLPTAVHYVWADLANWPVSCSTGAAIRRLLRRSAQPTVGVASTKKHAVRTALKRMRRSIRRQPLRTPNEP